MNDEVIKIIKSATKDFLSDKDPKMIEVKSDYTPWRHDYLQNPSLKAYLPDKLRTINIELGGDWDFPSNYDNYWIYGKFLSNEHKGEYFYECPKCGNEVKTPSNYCPKCGKRLFRDKLAETRF